MLSGIRCDAPFDWISLFGLARNEGARQRSIHRLALRPCAFSLELHTFSCLHCGLPMRCLLVIFLLLLSRAARAQTSHNLSLVCHWNDTSRCPTNSGGQHWSDVWGFSQQGTEYAVIGSTTGAHIINLEECREQAFLPQEPQSAVHRDFKTYQHFLYCISAEGLLSSLRVYDLSSLPDTVLPVWQSNPDSLSRAFCLAIDTARGMLYLGTASGNITGTHSIAAYNLSNPASPRFVAYLDDFDLTHGMYVRNDTAWCSNGWGGFAVLDMSRLPALRALGGLTAYPLGGYNHSNWIGCDGIGVMSDENFGLPIKVIDVSKPTNIQVLSHFSPRGSDSTSMPHNPYLLGHLAFVSYYMDGLQVYDLSNPRQPQRVGWFRTYQGSPMQQYAGAWGCFPFLPSHRILVSDMQTGLYVLDAASLLSVKTPGLAGGLQLFPNPSGGVLHIRTTRALSKGAHFAIASSAGQVVAQGSLPMAEANAVLKLSLPPALAPGNYLLRLSCGDDSFTLRFTKP
jgi:hypothetical protein